MAFNRLVSGSEELFQTFHKLSLLVWAKPLGATIPERKKRIAIILITGYGLWIIGKSFVLKKMASRKGKAMIEFNTPCFADHKMNGIKAKIKNGCRTLILQPVIGFY